MEVATVREAVEQFLSPERYYRCLLLVADDVTRVERAAEELAAERGWHALPVNPTLAQALLGTPTRQWHRVARATFLRSVEAWQGPVVCYRVDLLFQPELRLNPVALFQEACRSTPLVVAWPGRYERGVLSYALPEHAHYRTWSAPDALVVSLGQ